MANHRPMLRSAVRRRGLPAHWAAGLVLVMFAAIAVGAGAAAGKVMGGPGEVQGNIPISVQSALAAGKPEALSLPAGRRFFSSLSDRADRFGFALEMYRSESQSVHVPIINRSTSEVITRLALDIPEVSSLFLGVPGLTIDLEGAGVIGDDDLVNIAPGEWSFTVPPGADGGPDGLLLTVHVHPASETGYFEISGQVVTTDY